MTIKLRATVNQVGEVYGTNKEQTVVLSLFDTDNKDFEKEICSINVDEIEISKDFVMYFYNGLKQHEQEEGLAKTE